MLQNKDWSGGALFARSNVLLVADISYGFKSQDPLLDGNSAKTMPKP